MRCPKCSQENPAGRGFCIYCASPLPEEPQQEPQQEPETAVVIPAPQAPVRKKVVGLGIAALIFGILSLQFVRSGLTMNVQDFGAYYQQAVSPQLLRACMYIATGILGLPLGILGTVFGGIALSRQQKKPECYSGKGIYIAAIATAVVGMLISAVLFLYGVAVL